MRRQLLQIQRQFAATVKAEADKILAAKDTKFEIFDKFTWWLTGISALVLGITILYLSAIHAYKFQEKQSQDSRTFLVAVLLGYAMFAAFPTKYEQATNNLVKNMTDVPAWFVSGILKVGGPMSAIGLMYLFAHWAIPDDLPNVQLWHVKHGENLNWNSAIVTAGDNPPQTFKKIDDGKDFPDSVLVEFRSGSPKCNLNVKESLISSQPAVLEFDSTLSKKDVMWLGDKKQDDQKMTKDSKQESESTERASKNGQN